MAKKIIPLTDTQIKSAKIEKVDYPLYDGEGLLLLIKSTGSKIWQFRYYKPITNKRTTVSFGRYPNITLQQARKMRDDARELLSNGIDPQEYKKSIEQQEIDRKENTFKKIACDWFSVKSKSNLKADTLKDIWRSVELHLLPYVGDKSIHELKALDFISALQPVKERGTLETVKRLIQRINEIMFYAVNVGIIDANPCVKISAAFENPTVTNMPTITKEELPQLLQTFKQINIGLLTRLLFQWQLLTMTRASEAVGAKWSEIDFDNKLWIIPAERMKMKREHVIPLCKQSLDILNQAKKMSIDKEFIFPSLKSGAHGSMNPQTVNAVIKRMGYGGRLVAHGLRALASTILNEQGFNYDAIEASLAHTDSNTVRRAYNRATYLAQRRIIMDWWGDFIEQASNGNVSLSGTKSFKVVNS